MSRLNSVIQIEGLEDLQKMFDTILIKEAQNLNRAVIHGIASTIAKSARQKAPLDTGRLRKAIGAHRQKLKDPNKPISDVYVTRGKKAKHNAWYWKYLEYGTQTRAATPFIQPAIAEARTNYKEIYREQFAKKLAQKIKRDAKKRLK